MEEPVPSEASSSPRQSMVARLWFICKPRMVWKAFLAAGLVGTVLVALNQGDVWWSGHVTRQVLMKSLLTPIIPFCVTLLGAFLNSGPTVRAEDLRPGWVVVRRSALIAICVGSAIILLNHGDVLLARAITPRALVKMLVTPCIPFCVSFYGAYAAYRQALAEQQHTAGMM
jgi:hypothetical protein